MENLQFAPYVADEQGVEPTAQSSPPAREPVARPRELRPLTGFRWLVGLSLFVHHALNYWMFATVGSDWRPDDLSTWQALMHQGAAAVAFFFLLSGFTLTWNYAERFRTLSGRSVASFYVNRIASIWPVHLVAFVLALAFVVDDLVASPLQVLTMAVPSLFLLQAWFPMGGPDTWTLGMNGPSWSLSALLFFYACFPVLIVVLSHIERVRPRLTVLIPVGWIAFAAAAAYAWQGDAYVTWLFHTYPAMRLIDFVVGISACLILLRAVRRGPVTLPGSRWGATAIEGGAIALLGASIVMHNVVPLSVRYSAWYVPALAVMVYVFARGGGILSALVGSRPLVWLGRIAFAFLMLHVMVMQYLFSAGVYAQSPAIATVLAFVLSFALAVAVHYLWEGPARRVIRVRGNTWMQAQFDLSTRGDAPDHARDDTAGTATNDDDSRAA